MRDELLAPLMAGTARWSCTVWPIASHSSVPDGLVLEMRDVSSAEAVQVRQRAIAERLLLGALREQDTASHAVDMSRRAMYLAAVGHELAMSLDQDETRDIVRRSTLPREGVWCIVDIVEPNGAIRRLAAVHPDPEKQALALQLDDGSLPEPGDPIGMRSASGPSEAVSGVITHASRAALLAAAHGARNLAILEEIGFGALLVVPLLVRARVLGAITFVTPEGGPGFTPDEIALASDVADRCAMALDNARLYGEADTLRASAEAANRAKTGFLGNVSHELMTPLNAIGGYAQLIDMGLRGPVTSDQRTDLSRIMQNQQHLIGLISEILSFVRNEGGRTVYAGGEVPVQAAIDDVAEMLHGAIQERRLTLEVRVDGDAVVWADPDRLRQILTNLVMNAVKYTPAGGGRILLASMVRPDAVAIEVADTGPGIPYDKLEAIFEPFVQLAGGYTNRQGGVGLGLSISRALARGMGGELTVESTLGVGSRFILTLPRARRESA